MGKRVLKVLSKLSLRRGPRCQLARRSKSNSSTRRRLKKRKPRMQSAMLRPKRAPKMRVRLPPKRVRRWAMWHQCKQSGLSFLKWKVKKRWQTRNGMPRPLLARTHSCRKRLRRPRAWQVVRQKKSAPVTSTTSTASLSPSKEAWVENNDDAPAEEEEPEAEANADEEGKTQVEEQQGGGCVIC